MSKRCAKCEKTVYPIEELKCLDKVWHKTCFRCWECNMALNMKNYKGYNKKPYCNAHYPKTSHTSVSETPEMARIAQNTKMQSQVKYHEDFEKNIKGSKIQVADDPETLRIKASTAVISSVEYKGLRERTNDMESRRSNLAQDPDGVYQEEPRRNSDYDPSKVGGIRMAAVAEQPKSSPYSNKNSGFSTVYNSQGKVEQGANKKVGSIADYDPLNERFGSLTQGYHPASARSSMSQWEETIPEPQLQNHAPPTSTTAVHEPPPSTYHTPPPDPEPAYRPPSPEPPTHQYQAPPQSYEPPPEPPTQVYREPGDAIRRQSSVTEEHYPAPQHSLPPQNSMPPPQQAYEPPPQPAYTQPQAPAQPPPQAEPVAPPPVQTGNLSGPVYQAIYDYDAQDDDEVGFIEGDLIIDCQPIDDGWMFGTVRRTGKRGMLPANYVERAQ